MNSLAAWRKRHGKTLMDVAQAAFTSDASISRIEHGKQRPTPALAKRLEQITDIPAADFVMGRAALQEEAGASS